MDHNDLHDELDAYLADDPPIDPDGDEIPPDTLKHDHDADRMLRAIARLQRDADDVRAVADAEIDRIRGWADDRTHGHAAKIGWLERSLAGFMAGRGVRTLKLPNGELTLRPAKQRIEVDESDELVAILESVADDLVNRKPQIVKAKIGERMVPSETVLGKTDDGLHEIRGGCVLHGTNDQGENVVGADVPGVRFLVPVGDVFKAKPTRGDVTLEPDYEDTP